MAATNASTIIHFKSKRLDPATDQDETRTPGPGGGLLPAVSTKGSFDGKILDLGWHEPVSVDDIDKVVGHIHRMYIETSTSTSKHHHDEQHKGMIFVDMIRTSEKRMQDLIREINASASHAKAQRQKQRCDDMNKPFKSRVCPYCASTISLSSFCESPQIYCHYCEAIFPKGGLIPYGEKDMHICTRCGFYSKPEKFSYRYMYVYVLRNSMARRHRVLCKGCEHEKARRVCCLNSVTLVGLPSALWSMWKARRIQDLPPILADLDRANTLVKRCDTASVNEGMKIYQKILQDSDDGFNAGIRYNMGMAYIALNNDAKAIESLKASLKDCSNYEPAAGMLLDCYRNTGTAETSQDVTEIRKLFGWDCNGHEERKSLRKVFFEVK
jgi:hypothetical protein